MVGKIIRFKTDNDPTLFAAANLIESHPEKILKVIHR